MKKRRSRMGRPVRVAIKPRPASPIVIGVMDCPACGLPNVRKLKDKEDDRGFYLEDHGMPTDRGGETQQSCPGIESFGTEVRTGGHLAP